MKKDKISVALAVFNEEKNLPACFDSVKDWVDEIVIVDGGSSDRTVTVAKRYGARVIETTNPPIFHVNKQKAIDACKGDWILQLDADEQVSLDSREEILKILPETNFNGFWLPRKNFFLGRFLKKGGQYPDYTLRLYKKSKGRLPCKSVHEQAVVEGKVDYLKNDLLHFPFSGFTDYFEKAVRYSKERADKLFKENPHQGKISFKILLNQLCLEPKLVFFKLYFRHLGFKDGFPGFVFAFFSAIQEIMALVFYFELGLKGK